MQSDRGSVYCVVVLVCRVTEVVCTVLWCCVQGGRGIVCTVLWCCVQSDRGSVYCVVVLCAE